MQENPNHSGQKPCRAGRRGWIHMRCQTRGEPWNMHMISHILQSRLAQRERCASRKAPVSPPVPPVLGLELKAPAALPNCLPGAETVAASTEPLGGQARRNRLRSSKRKSLSGIALLVPCRRGTRWKSTGPHSCGETWQRLFLCQSVFYRNFGVLIQLTRKQKV